MNKGGNKMGFHKEQFIGGLHIVAMPHALTFRGKQLLVLKTSQMLNDGVTVNQIKGTILERKVLAIRNNQGKVTLSLGTDRFRRITHGEKGRSIQLNSYPPTSKMRVSGVSPKRCRNCRMRFVRKYVKNGRRMLCIFII